MGRKILIITTIDDAEAYFVSEALRIKGAEVTMWTSGRFPSESDQTLLVDGDSIRFSICDLGREIGKLTPDVVWNRYPGFKFDEENTHPEDVRFVEREISDFYESFLASIFQDAFWVNPWLAARNANHKIRQHIAAVRSGLRTPKTLYGNDPARIREFIRGCGGKVAFKTLTGGGWKETAGTWVSFTSLLTEEMLVDDAMLRQVPSIYQEIVEKDHELRVIVAGEHILAAKLFSQKTEKGKLDWRKAYDELDYSPTELPHTLKEQIHSFMREMGLVYGVFDFAVTPGGEYVFFEVNQTSAWSFMEGNTGLPVLDLISEILVQGKERFPWNLRSPRIRLHQEPFRSTVLSQIEKATGRRPFSALPKM